MPGTATLDQLTMLGQLTITDALAAVDELEAIGPWVVVSCGGAKLAHRAPAGELYTGSYHAAARRAAAALTSPNRTLILSARYGLVRLVDELEPYDLHMRDARAINPWDVAAQARKLGVSGRVVVLGGRAYADCLEMAARHLARPHRPGLAPVAVELETPCAGGRGIGDQLATFARIAGGAR